MTDRTKTRAELVTMIAYELMLIASGQSLEADDQAAIDARMDGMFGDLAGQGIAEVSNEEEIPVEWCDALAEIGADLLAPTFGQPKNPVKREMAENRLRVITRRVPTPIPLLKSDSALTLGPIYTYNRWLRGL